MARFFGGGSSGPDYVQPDEPTDPESPERWYDTDADPDGDSNAEGAMKVYGTDGTWHTVTIDDHGELGGVLEDNHHSYPIPTSGLADAAVTAAKVAFDYVTPTELSNHESDPDAHHGRPTGTDNAGGPAPAGRSGTGHEMPKFEIGNSGVDYFAASAHDFYVTPVGMRLAEVAIENSGSYDNEGRAEVIYADGTTTPVDTAAGNVTWHGLDNSKVVLSVEFANANGHIVGINPLTATSHSHDIQ